jgi:hypothetical protein
MRNHLLNMKSKSLTILLATGIFLLPGLSAQASVDSTLKLEAKFFYQLRDSVRGDKEIGSIKAVRIDSKQLLILLSKQAGIKYVGGTQLEVAVDGQVYVTDSKGNRLGNVSKYFQATFDTQSRLFGGSRNVKTGQEISRNYFPVSFTIDLPQLKGTLKGLASELFKVTTPTKDGVQITSGTTTADVDGKGNFAGALSYFDGKITLVGRQAVVIK